MGVTTDISKLRMAPVRIDPTRKPSGDTSTIMVRVHRDQYNALEVGSVSHANQIKCWHEAYIKQQQSAERAEGECDE